MPPDTAILRAVRHAFLSYLQVVSVLLVGVLVFGLTFLIDAATPWPLRAGAGALASTGVYFGTIRSRPRPWRPEPSSEETQ